MFFSLRVIHNENGDNEYFLGEIIETSLEEAYDLVLQKFRKNENEEVFIYTIEYDFDIKLIRKSHFDFRPYYL